MTLLWVIAIAVVLAAMAYAGIVAFMYGRQRALLFHPSSDRPEIDQTALNGVREELIETSDGLSLLSWYAPPTSRDRGIFLVLHGNAGSLAERTEKLRPIRDAGFGVLALAWRGYSGNSGQPTEPGLMLDAEAAADRLLDLGHAPDEIILYGESLGTAIATRLATKLPVAALILEAPPLSIVKVGQQRYPWLPVDRLLKDRFETDRYIADVRCPVLIMHSRVDKVVPFEMGRELADLANGKAEFRAFDEASHVDLYLHGATEKILGFLRSNGLLEQS